jgi:hypothetical protein
MGTFTDGTSWEEKTSPIEAKYILGSYVTRRMLNKLRHEVEDNHHLVYKPTGGACDRESPFVVFDCNRGGGSIGGCCGVVGLPFLTSSYTFNEYCDEAEIMLNRSDRAAVEPVSVAFESYSAAGGVTVSSRTSC